jgi:acetylornithine deacetylase/succinyl-diaminopimelate desuccinylase-like protein
MENKDLKILFSFLKIKSISAQKEYRSEMAKARDFLFEIFKKNGFKTKILKGSVHDLVYAEKIVDLEKPTVLIYGHYDVQPPDPINEWKTDPFSPVIKNGNIFARGTSDDKGQIMANIIAGLRLVNKYKKSLPVNLKYIIEGEEEVGSISIPEIAKKYSKNLLKCDYLLVSDSEMIEKNKPAIDISLRGLSYMEVKLRSADHDLHSGSYGGIAENPAIVLSRIITELKGKDGRILIPGFYDDVIKPTSSEALDFAKVKTSANKLKEEGEFYVIGGGENNYSLNDRRWTRPTLDVNGIGSGYQEEGSKTIIPASAFAKISMRLVPNQTPERVSGLFEKYLQKIVPEGIKLTVITHSGAYPYKAPTDDAVFSLAKTCLTKAFGGKATFNGVGGSIGFVPIVANTLNVPCIMIGYGLPTDNIHAPNEHISMDGFLNGANAATSLLENIPTVFAKK